MKPSGTSHYRLALTTAQLQLLRCPHAYLSDMYDDPADCLDVLAIHADTCRCCSVQAGMVLAGQADAVDWDVLRGEHGNLIRATVYTDQGRVALTRLLAYVQGHREPLELQRQP